MLLMTTGASPSGPSELLTISRVAIVRVSPTVMADWAKVGPHEIVRPAFADDGAKPTTSMPARNRTALTRQRNSLGIDLPTY
jgi:hypothetical protein